MYFSLLIIVFNIYPFCISIPLGNWQYDFFRPSNAENFGVNSPYSPYRSDHGSTQNFLDPLLNPHAVESSLSNIAFEPVSNTLSFGPGIRAIEFGPLLQTPELALNYNVPEPVQKTQFVDPGPYQGNAAIPPEYPGDVPPPNDPQSILARSSQFNDQLPRGQPMLMRHAQMHSMPLELQNQQYVPAEPGQIAGAQNYLPSNINNPFKPTRLESIPINANFGKQPHALTAQVGSGNTNNLNILERRQQQHFLSQSSQQRQPTNKFSQGQMTEQLYQGQIPAMDYNYINRNLPSGSSYIVNNNIQNLGPSNIAEQNPRASKYNEYAPKDVFPPLRNNNRERSNIIAHEVQFNPQQTQNLPRQPFYSQNIQIPQESTITNNYRQQDGINIQISKFGRKNVAQQPQSNIVDGYHQKSPYTDVIHVPWNSNNREVMSSAIHQNELTNRESKLNAKLHSKQPQNILSNAPNIVQRHNSRILRNNKANTIQSINQNNPSLSRFNNMPNKFIQSNINNKQMPIQNYNQPVAPIVKNKYRNNNRIDTNLNNTPRNFYPKPYINQVYEVPPSLNRNIEPLRSRNYLNPIQQQTTENTFNVNNLQYIRPKKNFINYDPVQNSYNTLAKSNVDVSKQIQLGNSNLMKHTKSKNEYNQGKFNSGTITQSRMRGTNSNRQLGFQNVLHVQTVQGTGQNRGNAYLPFKQRTHNQQQPKISSQLNNNNKLYKNSNNKLKSNYLSKGSLFPNAPMGSTGAPVSVETTRSNNDLNTPFRNQPAPFNLYPLSNANFPLIGIPHIIPNNIASTKRPLQISSNTRIPLIPFTLPSGPDLIKVASDLLNHLDSKLNTTNNRTMTKPRSLINHMRHSTPGRLYSSINSSTLLKPPFYQKDYMVICRQLNRTKTTTSSLTFGPIVRNCGSFVKCDVNGTRITPLVKRCSFGLWYDPASGLCTETDAVPLCLYNPCKNYTTTQVNIPHSSECGAYYTCEGGSATAERCELGINFDVTTGQCCVPPKRCRCPWGPTPLTSSFGGTLGWNPNQQNWAGNQMQTVDPLFGPTVNQYPVINGPSGLIDPFPLDPHQQPYSGACIVRSCPPTQFFDHLLCACTPM